MENDKPKKSPEGNAPGKWRNRSHGWKMQMKRQKLSLWLWLKCWLKPSNCIMLY